MKLRFTRILGNEFKNDYQVSDKKLLESIKEKNRNTLSEVTEWLNEDVSRKSYYNYGVPDSIKDLLDKEIGMDTTYTDLLSYYSRHLNNISYLELGVSVGKNFLQLTQQFLNSSLTGFDIENINNPLKDKFTCIHIEEWPTPHGSLRKENSLLQKFEFNSNSIFYLAGDIWDENSWVKLKGKKFNLIFSDALHDPKALLWEYEMIMKYNLLSEDFIFFWDDLNNGLEKSFQIISADLKVKRNMKSNEALLIKINGWLGNNYPLKHDVGIISNLALT